MLTVKDLKHLLEDYPDNMPVNLTIEAASGSGCWFAKLEQVVRWVGESGLFVELSGVRE